MLQDHIENSKNFHIEHILWSTLDLHIVQIGYNILIPLPLPDCSQKGVLAVLITFYQPPQFSVRTVSTAGSAELLQNYLICKDGISVDDADPAGPFRIATIKHPEHNQNSS